MGTHEEVLAVVDELVDEVVVELSSYSSPLPSEVQGIYKHAKKKDASQLSNTG